MLLYVLFYFASSLVGFAIEEQDRCSNGPYFFDAVDMGRNPDREGVGKFSKYMLIGMIYADIFNLRYIVNHEWFISSHLTHYGDLFDFRRQNELYRCTEEDVAKPPSHVHIVNISSIDQHPDVCDVSKDRFCYDSTTRGVIKDCRWCKRIVRQEWAFLDSVCQLNKKNRAIPLEWYLHDGGGRTMEQFMHHMTSKGSVTDNEMKRTIFRYNRRLGWGHTMDCINEGRECSACTKNVTFHSSFWSRKHFDISQGVQRYYVPHDVLIIGYMYRFGDVFYREPGGADFSKAVFRNSAMPEVIAVIKGLFLSQNNVLKDYQGKYKIYFFSEVPYWDGYGPSNHTDPATGHSYFKLMVDAFPPEVLEIRVNHAQHLEDVDIMASADIIIAGERSFHHFVQSLALKSTVRLFPPHYSFKKLLECDKNETIRLNREICDHRKRPPVLQSRCVSSGLVKDDSAA